MPRLQQALRSTGDQLSGLPATAKLLIGSLMVILVLSLLLVGQYASRSSMVPLQIRPEARTAALRHLEAAGIPYQERNDKVMVPAQRQHMILSRLTDTAVITGEQIDFDSLIKENSPFLTRDQNDKRWLVAKMNVLSGLISGFGGIDRATVVIDPSSGNRGFGVAHIPPTASVNVVPKGELTQSQAEAIAALVAASEAGLKPANVSVIDARTLKQYQPRSADDLSTGKYLDVKRRVETHVKRTISELLDYIPGVRIGVNAMVDTSRVVTRRESFEDPKIGPLSDTSESEESVEQRAAAEPGMRPNAGAKVASRQGAMRTHSREATSSRTWPAFPTDSSQVHDPRGYPLKINAIISVPRSYFVATYRQDLNDADAVPDDAALTSLVVRETSRIKAAVEPLIDTVALENAVLGTVVVDMIPDFGHPGVLPAGAGDSPVARWVGTGSGGGAGAIDSSLLKQLGLAALALLALLLMLLMVRKAGVREPLPTPAEMAGMPAPLSTGDVVGEAEESDVALEGVELDVEALRRYRMISQVNDMVKKNPDEVANLLRRWISTVES